MSGVTVAVLLVLYNDKSGLTKLLKSLLKQSYKAFTIYAIDNYPEKESSSKVIEYFPNAIILPSQGNIGFAKANNLLAIKAIEDDCEYLFVLNPDMELAENCIEELYNLCESDPIIGAVGSVLLFGKEEKNIEKIQLFGGKIDFRKQKKTLLFSSKCLREISLPETKEVDYLNAGSLFIKGKAIIEADFFEEDYFMYNDEIDFAFRLKNIGYKLVVTSRTKIWHHHNWSKRNKKGYYLMYYYMMRNRFLYFLKYRFYFNLVIDLIWQLVSLPIKIKWLMKLCDLRLVMYYYLGIINGLKRETNKSSIIFD